MSETPFNKATDGKLGLHLFPSQSFTELLKTCAPQQRALLSLLAIADRFGIALAPMVRSLADELPARYRDRTQRLADQIELGVEPLDALQESPDVLPAECILALRLARDKNVLGELYALVLKQNPSQQLEVPGLEENHLSKIARLLLRFFVVACLLMFLMVKIVPEFKSMLAEFGVNAPSSLIQLILICDYFAKFWWLALLLLVGLVSICFPALLSFFRTWNPLMWRQQVVHRSVNQRQQLALIAAADQPLSSSLATMMLSEPCRRARQQLRRANQKIENGQDPWEALARENVISRRDAEAMNLSADRQTQAWLLRWSAANCQNRQSSRSVIITHTIVFLANIALGIVVALACVAVFMTLINIMNSLH